MSASGKARKTSLLPVPRQEKLADLLPVFPGDFKCNQKSFIHIPSLHSFEANWSILKFAIDNRKLLTLAFSVAFLNRRDQISLFLLIVQVKDLGDAHVKDVKDAREMARVRGLKFSFKFSS